MKVPIRSHARPPEWVAYRVPPEKAGLRLDTFLTECLHWRSRNQVQELIRARKIKVNGGRAKKSLKVVADDLIEVKVPPPAREPRPDLIPIDIIFEDDDLLALNKPPGVVCHPVGQFQYETLVNALHLFFEARGTPFMPQLCHRLDRETSGVLLIAKTPAVRAKVQAIWEARAVEKRYVALATGVLADDEGRIDLPLAPHPDSPGGLKMHVAADGLEAHTAFRVLERLDGATHVEVELFTGRQHQIRAHLHALGHPLLCDTLYLTPGGDAPSRWREEQQAPEGPGGLCRQALHALRLRMRHPTRGETLDLHAPPAPDFRAALAALQLPSEETR